MPKQMPKQVGAEKMREIADILFKELDGLGFALITFEFKTPSVGNYISNGERPDMIQAIEETLTRLKNNEVYKTPEEN